MATPDDSRHATGTAIAATRRRQLAVCAGLGLAGLGLAVLGLGAVPAAAVEGGSLDTMRIGHYHCELPGNAGGPVGVRVPGEDFEVLHSSRYAVGDEQGIYLLIGDLLQLTSGPKQGARYRRVSNGFLRKLNADGTESTLRCVRGVLNNGG